MVEKTYFPRNPFEKWTMCGTGWLSGIVRTFKSLYSAQGHHGSAFWGTMYIGEDHGLSEVRTIPSWRMASNSRFTTCNWSKARSRGLVEIGGPSVVLIWCTAVCFTVTSRPCYCPVLCQKLMILRITGTGVGKRATCLLVVDKLVMSTNLLLHMSTCNPKFGIVTSAIAKHQVKFVSIQKWHTVLLFHKVVLLYR